MPSALLEAVCHYWWLRCLSSFLLWERICEKPSQEQSLLEFYLEGSGNWRPPVASFRDGRGSNVCSRQAVSRFTIGADSEASVREYSVTETPERGLSGWGYLRRYDTAKVCKSTVIWQWNVIWMTIVLLGLITKSGRDFQRTNLEKQRSRRRRQLVDGSSRSHTLGFVASSIKNAAVKTTYT